MSQEPFVLTAWAGIELAVECMKRGAADFVAKPWDDLRLQATLLAALRTGMLQRKAEEATLRENLLTPIAETTSLLVARSEPMKQLLETVNRVACTNAAILIGGESGSGKSLLARHICQLSDRREMPFITADLMSQPAGLTPDYLFGHEPGAFTDARESRPGLFELANGGTLLLDEVAHLDKTVQASLLTALSSGLFCRLGSQVQRTTNIRLIATTSQSLRQKVAEGAFRQDLLYRINTVEISMPTLRHRADDFPLLFDLFNQHFANRYNKPPLKLTNGAMRKLQSYPWPGNVRELEHAIERAVVLSDNQLIGPDLLIPQTSPAKKSHGHNLTENERETISAALKASAGNMVAAARMLGIGRTTLYRKIQKYGL
ncbi:MAG: sigma-54 dependent transcriptional regulator [Bacteroidales bacterium]|nr:sigma-54 dependent transcriptional regulator [Bacteroidales bacterium]